jgi:hypothetical protein
MREIRNHGTWLLTLALANFPLCCLSAAQTASRETAAPTPSELFKRVSSSVFVVESLDSGGAAVALGSGVSIAKDEVVTNRHVVEDGKSWRVRQGDNTWAAKIAYLDSEHDLCGLQVVGLNATPVPVRPSSTLSVGDRVYALGTPEGLPLSLSEGLVSGLRQFEGVSLIQTTAPISHGSSGGGLFDSQGKLIGITTFVVKDGQNLNFALPTEWVLGLKEHPSTEVHQTEVERNASQAMLLLEAAQDAMESDNYEKALQAYKELVELKPDDPFLWSFVGELYLKLKQPNSAIEACQKAVRLGPDKSISWACLGDVYERLGQYPQAEAALRKAVDLDPAEKAQLVNLFCLGRVLAEEDKRIAAMGIYDRLKTLDRNYADRFYQLFIQPMLDSPER